MSVVEADIGAAVKDAVAKERERCKRWATALRTGELDDVRSVIYGISGGSDFDEDVES